MTTENREIESPWLTPDEAAAYLKMSTHTLANWRRDGLGPPYSKHGERGNIRYRRDALDAWMDAQSIAPQVATA